MTKIQKDNSVISRRQLVLTAAVSPLVFAATPSFADAESPLIYISPLKSDGTVSRCQAEVWFLGDAGHHYVVTDKDAWRAEAVRKGLTSAQIWVGDVGRWQRSGGKYKELPSHQASVTFETDAAEHTRLLEGFGQKYANEWGSWGPRFKNGLADGSRVMLKYTKA